MGGMNKRQETTSLRSSSLRRDSVVENNVTAKGKIETKTTQQTTHHVNVGCMSGIFQFVSKYHTRRKFLTSGKEQERKATTTTPKKPKNATCQPKNRKIMSTEVTLESPRSPTIPADLRRQPLPSSDSPWVVPCQTGPNDVPATFTGPTPATEVVAAEKKRRLLGALEKCDEDLQALKRVIEEVRARQTPPTTPSRGGGSVKRKCGEEEEVKSEEISPVSVLDHHRLVARSPNMSFSLRTLQEKSVVEHHQQMQQQHQHRGRNSRVEEANALLCFRTKVATMVTTMAPTTSRWSTATRESVIQVCRDVELGHRREVGVFVLVLEDLIFRDLLDEIIKELHCLHDSSAYYACNLRYEACKRKLSF